MAKEPRTPKSKTGVPAQFDMNSRERKGGKGGPGRRGRDDNRPPSRIENLPPSLVDRGEGWTIWKVGKIDQASHAPAGAEYQLIFDGHEPLVFGFLGAARNRSKEAPPEKAAVGGGCDQRVRRRYRRKHRGRRRADRASSAGLRRRAALTNRARGARRQSDENALRRQKARLGKASFPRCYGRWRAADVMRHLGLSELVGCNAPLEAVPTISAIGENCRSFGETGELAQVGGNGNKGWKADCTSVGLGWSEPDEAACATAENNCHH